MPENRTASKGCRNFCDDFTVKYKKGVMIFLSVYPVSVVYELPIDENDYIRISIDLTINRNRSLKQDEIDKILENAFKIIKGQYKII